MSEPTVEHQLVDLLRDLTSKLIVEQALVQTLVAVLISKGVVDRTWLNSIRGADLAVHPDFQDAVSRAHDDRMKALERLFEGSKA